MAEAKKTTAKAAKKAPAKAVAKPAVKKAVAKKTSPKIAAKKSAPTYEQIAALAHRYWQERGHHHGSDAQDWLRAEKELRG
jgi:hypothetical protein